MNIAHGTNNRIIYIYIYVVYFFGISLNAQKAVAAMFIIVFEIVLCIPFMNQF